LLQQHGISLDRRSGGDLPFDLSVAADRGFLGSPIGWEIGTPVVALANGGGYAEYIAVPASQVLPQPNMGGPGIMNTFEDADVPLENSRPDDNVIEAAAIPESFFTVWHNLVYTAGLQPGEICLIHGALSGIGKLLYRIFVVDISAKCNLAFNVQDPLQFKLPKHAARM
jgi:NADPH2:quinone reductase